MARGIDADTKPCRLEGPSENLCPTVAHDGPWVHPAPEKLIEVTEMQYV